VAQLSQFHLQLALEGTRPLGENVENQAGAIQYPAFQLAFEVALLARGERMVDQQHLDLVGCNSLL